MRRVGLLVACGSAACYSPNLPPNAPCPSNSNDECPSGQVCRNSLCVTDGSGGTGASPVTALDGLQLHAPCQGAHTGNLCHATGDNPTPVSIGGDTGRTYQVSIRVRGVAELSVFDNGTLTPKTNWFVGGFGTHDDNTSDFSFSVTSPAQIYHLNGAATNSTGVVMVDYSVTFPINGGSIVTYFVDPGDDNMEALNLNPAGAPITIEGVTTSPSPYDGQFLQVNVTGVQ